MTLLLAELAYTIGMVYSPVNDDDYSDMRAVACVRVTTITEGGANDVQEDQCLCQLENE